MLDDDFGFWRLCDEFSVVHAALLIIGVRRPEKYENVLGWNEQDRPIGFTPAFTALTNAINSGKITATIRREAYELNGYFTNNDPGWRGVSRKIDGVNYNWEVCVHPDWAATTIARDELTKWLGSRGVRPDFFFPDCTPEGPGYLNSANEKYAPKLAAAVSAWLAVANDPAPSPKTPKQRLEVWLRKNADKYGLTKDDGNPNETGIEEVSKVANWSPGGPSKTPQ
jgi:hypothetical protein